MSQFSRVESELVAGQGTQHAVSEVPLLPTGKEKV